MTHHHPDLTTLEPGLHRATVELGRQAEAAARSAGLGDPLVELVKIRVSQLNGCAFCLRLHSRDALDRGVTADQLAVLPAWRETAYFDQVTRDALELAERVTRISAPAPGEAPTSLTDAQVAAVAWVSIVMNAFNRIAITSHYAVRPAAQVG